jgi:hypothetical protein
MGRTAEKGLPNLVSNVFVECTEVQSLVRFVEKIWEGKFISTKTGSG